MLNKLLQGSIHTEDRVPREGELYKTVTTFGRTFDLLYGYYDDLDRTRAPDIIYPDFISSPVFTDGGEPFVTMMQDSCESYRGAHPRTEDSVCSECAYFRRGEEWFGICTCPERCQRKKE